MKLLKFGPPPWMNQDLTLFHGTLDSHVNSILNGIDYSKLDADSDFGKGFYTTTNLLQAWRFADMQSELHGGIPAVLSFTLKRDKLAILDSLWFVLSTPNAIDYWSIVESCRAYGTSNRGISSVYDAVIGPVARNYELRQAWKNYDQVSFHTDKAFRLLDNSVREVV